MLHSTASSISGTVAFGMAAARDRVDTLERRINGHDASINIIDRLGSSIGVGISIGICNSSVSISTASAAASE